MYARIENGVAVEYPLYEGDLERRFSQYRFPLDDPKSIEANGGYIVPDGYVRVSSTLPPTDAYLNYNCTLGIPEFDGVANEWKDTWVLTPKSDEEKMYAKSGLAQRIREQRNKKLSEADVYTISDRWAQYSDSEKTLWTQYKQALRDIPTQSDFPANVIWPTFTG